MADFYLLSHAQYFIGSDESTFSALIANIIAAKGTKNCMLKSPLLWVSSFKNSCSIDNSRDKGKRLIRPDSCMNDNWNYNSDGSQCIATSKD